MKGDSFTLRQQKAKKIATEKKKRMRPLEIESRANPWKGLMLPLHHRRVDDASVSKIQQLCVLLLENKNFG